MNRKLEQALQEGATYTMVLTTVNTAKKYVQHLIQKIEEAKLIKDESIKANRCCRIQNNVRSTNWESNTLPMITNVALSDFVEFRRHIMREYSDFSRIWQDCKPTS